GAGVLVDAFKVADLLVDTGNLRGQAVHLGDRLHDVLVNIGALRLKVLGGVVEVGGQGVGRGQHALPQCQIRGIGGKLLQTLKEIADVGADAGTGARELGLNLLQLGQRGVERTVLLRCLIDLDLEHGVAQALDFFEDHSGANAERSYLHRIRCRYIRNLAGVSGRIRVGHV